MPNGLDAIGQQFHGDYGIQTDVQNEESLKTGIDSIDQQRDNKNYRYIGFIMAQRYLHQTSTSFNKISGRVSHS